MRLFLKSAALAAAVALASSGLLGCAMDEYTARARAANDLGVPENQLHVSEVGNHTFEIEGNGSSATYTCIGNGTGPYDTFSNDWSCVREAEPQVIVVEHGPRTAPLPPLPPRALGPEPKMRSFDVGAARAKLSEVNLDDCAGAGVHGYGRARVTFDPSGKVKSVDVASPEQLPVSDAACIKDRYAEATVPPFDGAPVVAATRFYVR